MKLQHHIGDLEGFDDFEYQKDVFVEDWEERIFAIHEIGMSLGIWTWGHLRRGGEQMDPLEYFEDRYYEKWLGGISGFLLEEGYFDEQELAEQTEEFLAGDAGFPENDNPEVNEQVMDYLKTGDSPQRDVDRDPKFEEGEEVRIKDIEPVDHTRLPGHLRNETGVVSTVYEGNYTYFFPTGEDGVGEEAMPIYAVEFDPAELWDYLAEENELVYADLYEAYLEPA